MSKHRKSSIFICITSSFHLMQQFARSQNQFPSFPLVCIRFSIVLPGTLVDACRTMTVRQGKPSNSSTFHFTFRALQSLHDANMSTLYRPMKKKGGGTLAGIPRASGERNSPVGNGASSNNQVSSFSSLQYLVDLYIL